MVYIDLQNTGIFFHIVMDKKKVVFMFGLNPFIWDDHWLQNWLKPKNIPVVMYCTAVTK